MPNHVGYVDVTKTDDTAGGLGTIGPSVTQASLKCEDNALRWRADGTAPTNDVGKLMNVGDELLLVGNDYGSFLNAFSFINDADGSNARIQGPLLDGFDRA
jgi:hypothetical protein